MSIGSFGSNLTTLAGALSAPAGSSWMGTVSALTETGTPSTVGVNTPFVGSLSVAPIAAFSLRLTNSAYAGNCIIIQRSSDSTTQAIGFTGAGVINLAALLAFVGSSNGYIQTWYDQSGNGNNFTQTTQANMPLLVNAGTVNTVNGLPAPSFNGTTQSLQNTTMSLAYQGSTINGVARSGNTTWVGTPTIWAGHFSNELQDQSCSFLSGATQYCGVFDQNNNILTGMCAGSGSTTQSIYKNGALSGGPSAITRTGSGTSPFTLGAYNGGAAAWYLGTIQEVLVFTAALGTTDRQTVEHNQEQFYGISGS